MRALPQRNGTDGPPHLTRARLALPITFIILTITLSITFSIILSIIIFIFRLFIGKKFATKDYSPAGP